MSLRIGESFQTIDGHLIHSIYFRDIAAKFQLAQCKKCADDYQEEDEGREKFDHSGQTPFVAHFSRTSDRVPAPHHYSPMKAASINPVARLNACYNPFRDVSVRRGV